MKTKIKIQGYLQLLKKKKKERILKNLAISVLDLKTVNP